MTEEECRRLTTCRLCESDDLRTVIKLTPTPPGNHFVAAEDRQKPFTRYPLECDFCQSCFHLQLAHVVDPKILYQQSYSYVSATSPVFVRHLQDYAKHITTHYDVEKGLVADIGSNDGTCLRAFQELGYPVLGIDPATEIADGATAAGVETIADFFGLELAKKLREERGPAAFITSHNACAHIDDLRGVFEGVKTWLADDGLFVMEVGYLVDVYSNLWFDTIYHEHLDYHSVAPLVSFFPTIGMEVIRVERIAPQGGSIRVVVQHQGGPRERDSTVDELLALEKELGLDRAETFQRFTDGINGVKQDLSAIVRGLRADGKSIAGFGAPTKATTLLSHFELGDALDFIVDDNPLKQGMFSPGHHIPVYAASEIYERRPDYVLVLAWNFAEPIMKKHQRYADEIGKFILPMPTARVVE